MSVAETDRRDPAEDLAMIRQLMEQSHGVVHGAAPHYLLWGVLITAGELLNWASVRGFVEIEVIWVWLVVIGLGWLGAMWIGYRQERTAAVTTPAGRVMGAIWLGAGATMTLLGFVGGGTGSLDTSALVAALAAVMGAAYFATGALHESPWPRVVAAGWWAGAAAIFLWPGPHALLVMAGLMVAFHVVPGLVIYRAARDAGAGARGEPAP